MTRLPHKPSVSAYATDRGWEFMYKGQPRLITKCDGLIDKLKEAGLDEFGKPIGQELLTEPAPVVKRGRKKKETAILLTEPAPETSSLEALEKEPEPVKIEDEEKAPEVESEVVETEAEVVPELDAVQILLTEEDNTQQ